MGRGTRGDCKSNRRRGMNTIKLIAACALFAWAAAASAQDYSVVVHGLSHHAEQRPAGKWNEVNTGLALRYAPDADLAYQVGLYRNSIDLNSVYALSDWTPLHVGVISFGGFAGGATGYKARPVSVIGGAVARVQIQRVSLALRMAPKAGIGGSAVVSVEAGFYF